MEENLRNYEKDTPQYLFYKTMHDKSKLRLCKKTI